ncbi:MAG: hypothetical protein ACREL5_05135 [Gemmatimonadales bacterium]
MRHVAEWGSVLMAAVVSTGHAQAVPHLSATRDLDIDAASADLSRTSWMTVSRSGDILVAQMDDGVIKVFSPAGQSRTIGHKGGGPGEFARLTRLGWIGDTLWTLDPANNRITFFGPDYKLLRTIPEPVGIQQRDGSGRLVDTGIEAYIQAVIAPGDLRAVIPITHPKAPWENGIDSGSSLLARINRDGVYKSRIAVEPPEPACHKRFEATKGTAEFLVPFCAIEVSTDWDGSGPVAVATPLIAGRTTGYDIELIDESGRSVFKRSTTTVPVMIPKSKSDSANAAHNKWVARLSPGLRSAAPSYQTPRIYPAVRRVLVGRDHSVWVEERNAAPGHTWRVFDPTGMVKGTLQLPENVSLQAAQLGTVWGFETDEDGLQGVVRYRVTR